MPPKMAIHTTHVRGGTRKSPPFLAFLSSSLYLLSSDIIKHLLGAKLPCRNQWRNPIGQAFYLGEPRRGRIKGLCHRQCKRRMVLFVSLYRSEIRRPSTQNTSPRDVSATANLCRNGRGTLAFVNKSCNFIE